MRDRGDGDGYSVLLKILLEKSLCPGDEFSSPDSFGFFRIPTVDEEPKDTRAIDGQNVEPQSSSLLLFLRAAGVKTTEASIK